MAEGHYGRGRANARRLLISPVESGGLGIPVQVADVRLDAWDAAADEDRDGPNYWAHGVHWLQGRMAERKRLKAAVAEAEALVRGPVGGDVPTERVDAAKAAAVREATAVLPKLRAELRGVEREIGIERLTPDA